MHSRTSWIDDADTEAPGSRMPASTDATDRRGTAVLAIFEHRGALQGMAVSLLGDAAAAQDVVQDTLESVLRLGKQFPDEASALRYARTAVLNKSRSLLRKRAVHRRFLLRTREEVAPPADEPVLLGDEHRTVLRQFDRLPPRQREVLTLRHFSMLDDDEIARVMQISPLTVRSNASRGIATLTKLLAKETDDD